MASEYEGLSDDEVKALVRHYLTLGEHLSREKDLLFQKVRQLNGILAKRGRVTVPEKGRDDG